MKRPLPTLLTLLLGYFLLISFSTNPPNGKTGAPGDGFCTECHNPPSSSIEGMQSITGLPDVVNPGETYNLTVTNTLTAGNSTRTGFQLVVLDDSNANAGSFGAAPDMTSIQSMTGRNYWEHGPAAFFNGSDEVRWTIEWTAPDGPVGDSIGFYGVAVLGNGSMSSGDLTVAGRTKVLLDIPSSIEDLDKESAIQVLNNPANQFLNLSVRESESIDQLYIYDFNGRIVESRNDQFGNFKIDVSNWMNGLYIVGAQINDEFITEKVLVQNQ